MRTEIRPAAYGEGIHALLRRVGLSSCELLVVPSVQDWARGVGLEEDEPFRAALAARRSDSVPTIVVLDCITEDIQWSIIPALEIRGFGEEVQRLEDLEVFLEHLILHEAAHLLLPAGASEMDCDRWAFDRLVGSLHTGNDA